jgi:DNA-binding NarL/FixJ family response regulator
VSKILIADDHAMVRAGIRQYLEAEPSIRAIGEAATGQETLEQLRTADWNLVLLDIFMPDQSGLDILRHIQNDYPNVRVLMLSGLPEKQYAVSVLRAGASGYLPKESPPEDLLKAVHTVLAGRRYVSPEVAELLVAGMDKDPGSQQHERLSAREFQVLTKLASGLTVSQIAEELQLSVKTVSTYRSRVLEKMGLKTNADLTSYALRHGLVQ